MGPSVALRKEYGSRITVIKYYLCIAVCCQVGAAATADLSSRGDLPSVMGLCVISKPEQRGGLGTSSATAPQKKNNKKYFKYSLTLFCGLSQQKATNLTNTRKVPKKISLS